MEFHLFGTIEDGLDPVLCEPGSVQSGVPVAYPDTGYDFVGVFVGLPFLRASVAAHLTYMRKSAL